jgi:predicted cation transporter
LEKTATKQEKTPWRAIFFWIMALAGVVAACWAAFDIGPSAQEAPMSDHGVAALIIGVVVTLIVGVGLMALVFWSSRRGYDDRAAGLSQMADAPAAKVPPTSGSD